MKITHIDGITHIRLDRVDELPAAMAMLPSEGKHRVEIIMPDAAAPIAPTPDPMPAPTPVYIQEPLPDMPAAKRRSPSLTAIGTVYVTPNTIEIMDLLRANPDGLTTRQMAMIKHRDELMTYISDPEALEANLVRLVGNLSSHVAAAQDRYGQVRKIQRSLVWTLSELGKLGNVELDGKPIYKNRANKALSRYLAGLKAGDVE